MTNKPKVLVLHTAVGHGIKVIAENIYRELEESGRFRVSIADFHEVEPGPIVRILEKIYYIFTETLPFIWGWIYSDLAARITIPFRMLAASFRYKKILSLIRQYAPDIVVSTETVPSGAVAYLKRKGLYEGKLMIAFSDYHLHRFWLYDEADLYLCNIPEQKKELLTLGVPREKIAVTGMIISEKFLQKTPRDEAVKAFGLNPDLSTVMVSGGRRGLVASKTVIKSLLASQAQFQIAVITGLNHDLKQALEKLPAIPKHDLKILGYVDRMDVLMSAADVLISKPGGPTIAEAVAKRLPVVLTDAHPGHETKNMEYLVRHKIAWSAARPEEAALLVERILDGRLKHNPEQGFAAIVQPPEAQSVAEILDKLA